MESGCPINDGALEDFLLTFRVSERALLGHL
jgi:hypothetical protein